MRRSSLTSFEAVESRRLLSGNVSVAFDGQLMDVRGDALGNQIVIAQNALNGVITVTGQNGTLVNGLASVRFANGASIEKLDVLMEEGDDRVTINRLNIAGDLNADMGIAVTGRDTLAINNSSIQGNLFAFGGFDADTINISGTTTFGDAIVDLAEGAGRSNVTGSTFNGSATFIGGEGADVFNATNMTVGLELKVESKEGNDTVTYSGVSAFIASFDTGLGADRVSLSALNSSEDVVVNTGDGNDAVTLLNVNAGKNLSVNLDNGNDSLSVSGSSAREDAILVGGAGVDSITDRGLTANKKEVIEFEVIL